MSTIKYSIIFILFIHIYMFEANTNNSLLDFIQLNNNKYNYSSVSHTNIMQFINDTQNDDYGISPSTSNFDDYSNYFKLLLSILFNIKKNGEFVLWEKIYLLICISTITSFCLYKMFLSYYKRNSLKSSKQQQNIEMQVF